MGLTDAHLHLPLVQDPPGMASAAEVLGIRLLSSSTSVADSQENLRLRKAHPGTVRSFAGIHPSEVQGPLLPEPLAALIGEADGVGEIGLDPKYSAAGRGSPQETVFISQLRLAEKSCKPVQVHSRGCQKEVLDALGSFRLKTVLLHWFEEEDLAGLASSRGYYVSFGPALLYSKKLERMAEGYPGDLILSESDAPVSYGSLEKVGGPTLIPSVLFAIAEAKRKRYGEVEVMVDENSSRFLDEG